MSFKEDKQDYQKKWYIKNKERVKEKSREYYRNNGQARCESCEKHLIAPINECQNEKHKQRYIQRLETTRKANKKRWNNLTFRHKLLEDSRKRGRKIGNEVIISYGGKCSCCGFNDVNKLIRGQRFLTIDKIDGKHKNLAIYGGQFYRWLKKNNYPEEFRNLCWPCNVAMEPNGITCELHKWEKFQNHNLDLVWKEIKLDNIES